MLPTLDQLFSRSAPVGVHGLGYVGLHLAAALAPQCRVLAYDPDPVRRDGLRAGFDLAGEFSAGGLAALGVDFVGAIDALSACRVILVAPPIPAGADGKPDLVFLRAALADVGRVIRPGTLVIVESSLSAALIQSECAAALSSVSGLAPGVDFHLAFSLGGIAPGDRVYRIADPLRCIVGDSASSALLARGLLASCTCPAAVKVSAQLGVDVRFARPAPPLRESIIGIACGVQVTLPPWMFGGQALSAQWIALGCAFTAFAALFLPDTSDGWAARARTVFATLFRCVPFWAGLMLMVLFACQALNPRLIVDFDEGAWTVVETEFVRWLPSGVDAPFDLARPPGGMNAARTLLMFSAPWLAFSALLCGMKSRRIVQGLWVAVVATAVAIAIFAIMSKLSGSTLLYGRPTAGLATPLGPFLYQNQGGAFLYLGFFAAITLTLRLWVNDGLRVSLAGPQALAAAGALVVLAAALLSKSFGSAVVLVASPLAIVPAVYLTRARAMDAPSTSVRDAIPALVASAGLIALLGVVLVLQCDFSGMVDKVRHKLDLVQTASLDDRLAFRKATRLMYADANPWYGTGAGSYRWLSPTYFEKIPECCGPDGRLRMIANYAHCDWLQILTEWGLCGILAVLAALIWVVLRMRVGLRRTAYAWPVLFGLVLLSVHAFWDFLIFNPAVLTQLVVCTFLILYSAQANRHEGDAARS